MISKGTNLVVADNSGGKKVHCIHILGSSKQRYTKMGRILLVSARKVRPKKKIVKKKIYRALLISTKREQRRKRVTFIKFKENRVLMLSDQNKFLGTRVYGPICKEMRGGNNELNYKTIISYSRATV
jgi:large subunit ribosomal protein L14